MVAAAGVDEMTAVAESWTAAGRLQGTFPRLASSWDTPGKPLVSREASGRSDNDEARLPANRAPNSYSRREVQYRITS